MIEPRIIPVPSGRPSFMNVPRCEDIASVEADIAILAIPFNVPYFLEASRAPSSVAPAAIREQSLFYDGQTDHYDFDFDSLLFAGKDVRIVDCGDVFQTAGTYDENNRMATAVVRHLLERGAVPVILGGDHGTTIPVTRGYDRHGTMCVVHLDAHLDFRDEVNGIHDGLSSPMRRASELPWVTSMIQIGLRGVGSARQEEIDKNNAFGSVRVPQQELNRVGVDDVLRRVPKADQYYISCDTDVLDPGIAPGINGTSFGGMTWFQVTNLINGIAAKGSIVGFDLVEVSPANDLRNITSMLGARLILNLIGALAHEGQIGR